MKLIIIAAVAALLMLAAYKIAAPKIVATQAAHAALLADI